MKIVVAKGYAAVRKDNFKIALSHVNCDWSKPMCEDNISNAIVVQDKTFAKESTIDKVKNKNDYALKYVVISVEIKE